MTCRIRNYCIKYNIIKNKLSQYFKTPFYVNLMKISNKKYRDLIALAKSANGRRETLDLLYEAAKFNMNK